jgi:hypothetical protein
MEDFLDIADLPGHQVQMGLRIDYVNLDRCERVGEKSGMYQIRLGYKHARQTTQSRSSFRSNQRRLNLESPLNRIRRIHCFIKNHQFQ